MKKPADQLPLLRSLAALSDPARMRVLRLLGQSELSVGELAAAMQLPQSTVSRHLKFLHDGRWISKRSEGTASLYRLAPDSLADADAALWKLMQDQLGSSPLFEHDDHRLAGVLTGRRTDSRSFFGRLGGEWDSLRRELFGELFTAEALLSLIPGDWIVADLGCGTGNAAELLAPIVSRVIAVDREPAMLEAARKRLADSRNIDFRQGELAALPIRDNEVHAAIFVLVLHHLPDPAAALAEARRVLKRDGLLLVVDMIAHDRESYRHTMGHQHLGFERKQFEKLAREAKLRVESRGWRRLRPDIESKGPGLFAATLRK